MPRIKIADKKRNLIKCLLEECTPAQVAFFYKLYQSIESIPVKKLDWAIKQCENTVEKNWGVR